MFTDEQKRMLDAPLVSDKVKSRQGLSYIEGWHAIAEANRIFGFDGWVRETVLMQETNRELLELSERGQKYEQWRVGYMAKVRITAGGVVREGVGFGIGISKPDSLSNAIESACKEAETDAMKRAMMTFGNPFGLALYDKDKKNVVDPDPLEHTEQAKRIIASAMKGCGVPHDKMAGLFKHWLGELGITEFEDTSVAQRKEFIESIQSGKYTPQKAEA
jgi:DNA recombination protein Rad52